MTYQNDAALAERLARTAGELLTTLRASKLFEDRAAGEAGDAIAHQFLVRALAEARPEDAVLSEEGAADPARLACRRVWIVDPLDGTREYSEGRSDWAVSRTRPGADSVAVAERIGADLVAMGSAGAKAMAVVRGEAEIYLHSGGQYEWDSCAPVAVARAHGLHVSRADGSALIYNRENPWMPDLLICRPEWAEAVLRETCRAPAA